MKELALHILDIAQNSITAGASYIEINVVEDESANKFIISVVDNGRGMSEEMVKEVTDPYVTSRTTRKVGMGIPLLKHTAEQSGGQLHISSKMGQGTMLEATLEYNHIDRPELGDLAGVVTILAGGNPNIRFQYNHIKNDKQFSIDTDDINQTLEGIPINEPEVLKFIKEMIRESLKELEG